MPVEQWGEAGGQAKRQSPCKGGAIVLQMMSLFAFQGQALHVDFYLVQRCKKCSCSGKIIIEECSAEMGMWVSVLKLQNLNVCQHNAATLELCFLFFFFFPKLNIKVTRVWCALVRSGLKQKHPSSKQPCEASFSCSQRHRELLFSSTDISCVWLEGDMLGARLHGHWPWEHPPEPWRLLLDWTWHRAHSACSKPTCSSLAMPGLLGRLAVHKMLMERGVPVSRFGQHPSCWPGYHQSWWWHSVISVFVFLGAQMQCFVVWEKSMLLLSIFPQQG